jgi:hypothetical protein
MDAGEWPTNLNALLLVRAVRACPELVEGLRAGSVEGSALSLGFQ